MMDIEELKMQLRAWYHHETPEVKQIMIEAAGALESLQRDILDKDAEIVRLRGILDELRRNVLSEELEICVAKSPK